MFRYHSVWCKLPEISGSNLIRLLGIIFVNCADYNVALKIRNIRTEIEKKGTDYYFLVNGNKKKKKKPNKKISRNKRIDISERIRTDTYTQRLQ